MTESKGLCDSTFSKQFFLFFPLPYVDKQINTENIIKITYSPILFKLESNSDDLSLSRIFIGNANIVLSKQFCIMPC